MALGDFVEVKTTAGATKLVAGIVGSRIEIDGVEPDKRDKVLPFVTVRVVSRAGDELQVAHVRQESVISVITGHETVRRGSRKK